MIFDGRKRAICACMGCKGGGILAISVRGVLKAESKMIETLGNGRMTSLNTSNGTRARVASVDCWSHSPASAPSAYAPVNRAPSLSRIENPFNWAYSWLYVAVLHTSVRSVVLL
jgi:hypothetical protein